MRHSIHARKHAINAWPGAPRAPAACLYRSYGVRWWSTRTLRRSQANRPASASAWKRSQQPQGTGALDGLSSAVGVELYVEMAHVGSDGVPRDVQLIRDLWGRQVG